MCVDIFYVIIEYLHYSEILQLSGVNKQLQSIVAARFQRPIKASRFFRPRAARRIQLRLIDQSRPLTNLLTYPHKNNIIFSVVCEKEPTDVFITRKAQPASVTLRASGRVLIFAVTAKRELYVFPYSEPICDFYSVAVYRDEYFTFEHGTIHDVVEYPAEKLIVGRMFGEYISWYNQLKKHYPYFKHDEKHTLR